MTKKYIALSPERNRVQGFKRPTDLAHLREIPVLPVNLGELAHAQSAFPLAFLREHEGWSLVALQAFTIGDNLLYDAAGAALPGLYLPQALRAYPFVLLRGPETEETPYYLGFDRDSGLLRETPDSGRGEERFYDDEGQPTAFMRELVAFMIQREKRQHATRRALMLLDQKRLMEPWDLSEYQSATDNPTIPGLHRVDVKGLHELEGNALKELQSAGALDIAYAQYHSMPRLGFLRALQQRRAQSGAEASAPRPSAGQPPATLSGTIDETIRFNF